LPISDSVAAYHAISKMVLLTMTPSIVEALQTLNAASRQHQTTADPANQSHNEPSLENPTVGNPVSHSQIVDIWSSLKDAGHKECTLETLLKGSRVYVPPPVPKPQPVGSSPYEMRRPK
jgi:hypothetical protein